MIELSELYTQAALAVLNKLSSWLSVLVGERRKARKRLRELEAPQGEQSVELSELRKQIEELSWKLSEQSKALREWSDSEWRELVRKTFIQVVDAAVVDASKWNLLEQLASEVHVRTPNRALGELTAEAIREFAAAPESYKKFVNAAALIQVLHSGTFPEFNEFQTSGLDEYYEIYIAIKRPKT